MGGLISFFKGPSKPKRQEAVPQAKRPSATEVEEQRRRRRAAALASGSEDTVLAGRVLGRGGLGAASLPTLLGRSG